MYAFFKGLELRWTRWLKSSPCFPMVPSEIVLEFAWRDLR
jgi:hypothetical protein